MTAILETPRIRLREFTAGDLDVLAPMVEDEEQMRFYPSTRDRTQASEWIDRNRRLYREHGFGFWLIEERPTSRFLGYSGIRPHESLPEIEIGWHITKSDWNRGLATEVALACRDLAFSRFGLRRLIGVVASENAASIRVAEKIGMQFEGSIVVDSYPHVIYGLTGDW